MIRGSNSEQQTKCQCFETQTTLSTHDIIVKQNERRISYQVDCVSKTRVIIKFLDDEYPRRFQLLELKKDENDKTVT